METDNQSLVNEPGGVTSDRFDRFDWRYEIIVEGAVDRLLRPGARNPYSLYDADSREHHRLHAYGGDSAEDYADYLFLRLRAA